MGANSEKMKKLIGLEPVNNKIDYEILEISQCNGYKRELIQYFIHERKNIAYLLLPDGEGKHPGILINHQHNGERNLGKGEVCGLAGNPFQSFGSVLAERGFVVIAPDSLCFEDRRVNASGIIENDEDDDWQHFLTMCYGILTGQTLAKVVIEDAMGAISVLNGLDCVDHKKIGCLGHSYGGNTTIFLTALDKRIHYACASGSAVTFRNRIKNNVGIEMASVIPNFMKYYDIDDVVCEICPTKFLILSATEDKYSKDAIDIYKKAEKVYEKYNLGQQISIKQYEGGHELTSERFKYIVNWIIDAVK
ncbi:acetylxylan esterase [Tissierella sp. Yu-01]|uniref:acetylxylan esterase n=1 Tax=Tissierella sp. Yu-01 TaxID=3035694 RepID=UPI00240CF526|nr:acetylxylan esterase [Tissierella sp. Yu-01]WFA08965.1 acetylxylan esterase [Tissierella sp. Yu-01]WFA08987.1 acetylxylan esterase [Tissierella sp. Yu-01]